MSVIVIDKNPSATNLRWFGIVVAAFFGVVGGIVWYSTQSLTVPAVLWSVGVGIAVVYYTVPPWRKAMYVGWMYLCFPLGWLMSHVILLATYYLVVTPIGVMLRLMGKDLLDVAIRPDAETYFVKRQPVTDKKQYFRQF